MDNKTLKYFFVLNGFVLLINIFLVGWEIKGQQELDRSFIALDKSFDALRSQHGAISARYQKSGTREPIFEDKTRLCSTPDERVAIEIRPNTQKAFYWPYYNHELPEKGEAQEYSYTISDGVVTLENAEQDIPYRIFKVIKVFYHDSSDLIKGLSGGIDMYSDWCGV